MVTHAHGLDKQIFEAFSRNNNKHMLKLNNNAMFFITDFSVSVVG
jgi:hypothetical protein